MLSLTILLLAQSLPYTGGGSQTFLSITGPNGGFFGSDFGREMTSIGDLDGDGHRELLIAEPTGGSGSHGRIFIFSGKTGVGLFTASGDPVLDGYGHQVACPGDLNGDGTPDIAISSYKARVNNVPDVGSVIIYSGSDFSVIRSFDGTVSGQKMGYQLALMNDMDGDGLTDFAVATAPPTGANQNRGIFFYSGGTGALLGSIPNVIVGIGFGECIANAGDLDGDGMDDILVGAPNRYANGLANAGTVYAYSTSTGAELFAREGNGNFPNFGKSIAGVGDQDGDGIPDFLCGSPQGYPTHLDPNGGAIVCSGFDGSTIRTHRGTIYGGEFGRDVGALGDLNEDGALEYCVIQGSVRNYENLFVYCGGNGKTIHEWTGRVDYFAPVGDIKGDGGPDVLLVNTKYDRNTISAWGVRAFAQTPVSELSASNGGLIPIDINFKNGWQWHYKVLVSGSGVGPTSNGPDIPLTEDGIYLNSELGIYPGDHHSNLHGQLDPTGKATAYFNFPTTLANSLIGQTFWFAVVAGPAAGGYENSSTAQSILITP